LNTPNAQIPWRGDYNYTSVSLTINGTTVTNDGTGVINVYNGNTDGYGYPTDLFNLYTTSITGIFGGLTLEQGAGIQVVLQDVSKTVFDDARIPGANLTINDFTLGNATFIQLSSVVPSLGLGYPPAYTISARGELTYLSAAPVPVPAAAWLFGSGLIGLASFTRRKNNSANLSAA
jgi:hypothetical protein